MSASASARERKEQKKAQRKSRRVSVSVAPGTPAAAGSSTPPSPRLGAPTCETPPGLVLDSPRPDSDGSPGDGEAPKQRRLHQLGRGSKNLANLWRTETFNVLPQSPSEALLHGDDDDDNNNNEDDGPLSLSHQVLAKMEEVPPWLRPVFQRIQARDPLLTKLAFEESCLRSCEVASLFGAVAAHNGVVKIRFSNKGFQDPRTGIVELVNCLEHMTSLQILELRNDALSVLPNHFGDCVSHLTELYLDHNELTALPLSVSSIAQLRLLNVAKNKLTALPASCARLVHLQHIDISGNRFAALPAWLATLPALAELRIRGNRLKNKPKQIDCTADVVRWIADTACADADERHTSAAATTNKKKRATTMINLNRRSTTVSASLSSLASPRRGASSSLTGVSSSSSASSLLHTSASSSSDDLLLGRTAAAPPRFVCRLLSVQVHSRAGAAVNVNPFVTLTYPDDYGDVRRSTLKLRDCAPLWADGEAAFLFAEPDDSDQPLLVSLFSRDFTASADVLLGSGKLSAAQLNAEGLTTLKLKDGSVVTLVIERSGWRVDEPLPGCTSYEHTYSLSKHAGSNIASISCDQLVHLLLSQPERDFLCAAFVCLHTFMPPMSFVTTLTAAQHSLDYAASLPGFLAAVFEPSFRPYLDVFLSHCDDACLGRFHFFLSSMNVSQPDLYPTHLVAQWTAVLAPAAPAPTATPSQGEFEPFLLRCSDDVPTLAEQTTLLELELLRAVKLSEVVPFVKGDNKRAPNLTLVTERFNLTTNWLISEIVSATRLKERVAVITACIRLGHAFLDLNNFQGVFEVVCALNSAPVSRMKRTWAEIDRDARDQFNSLEAIATPSDNYKNYRYYVQALPSCIPYVGVVVSDLTFILDGNPDRIDGMINWCKCRMIADAATLVSSKISQMAVPSRDPLSPHAFDLRCRMQRLCALSDARCYQLSLWIDPRGTYEDSLVDLINEERKLHQEISRLRARVAAASMRLDSDSSRPMRPSLNKRELKQRASSMCKGDTGVIDSIPDDE